MTEPSPAAIAHGETLIVPAPEGVDDAISAVMARHRAELDEALAPFDVTLDELVQATWMRFVRFADVVPLGAPAASPDVDEAGARACTAAAAADAAASAGLGFRLADADSLRPSPADAVRAGVAEVFSDLPAQPLAEGMTDAEREVARTVLPLLGGLDDGEACDPTSCASGCSRRAALPETHGSHDDRAGAPGSAIGCCGSGEACSSAACTGTPVVAAPMVDGVYVTDQLRDPEPFGERIDDGFSREGHLLDSTADFVRGVADRARAFQAEADRDGYGR